VVRGFLAGLLSGVNLCLRVLSGDCDGADDKLDELDGADDELELDEEEDEDDEDEDGLVDNEELGKDDATPRTACTY
jgi:hypothetical protein